MKTLIFALATLSFQLSAATVQLTVNLEGLDASLLKNGLVKFVSTNKLCRKIETGGIVIPVRFVDRKKQFPLSVKPIGPSAVLVEFDSEIAPGENDRCKYILESISLPLKGLVWMSLASTASSDFAATQTKYDLLGEAKLSATCTGTVCKREVNGVKADLSGSNLIQFYLNHKILNSTPSANIETTLTLK